ncbi:AraC family transcriptional regulator [Paenibacillus thalictri]|uniref:AraC family transcriptional regulator n=1 Tax=Paenibacillus thalictri TaxID=2527873 RepID=A0A4Q9DF39_9BACL|nr:AraC family transcriptional regulator [Paenibacillus thalictri]TBL68215.1 AraC family transcriptional regulator [Paenibacillus thalictri]
METNQSELMRSYLANAQVSLLMASHTKVGRDWRDLDFLPEFNRFYFIREGEGWLKIKGKEYAPKPGQLFWLPAGVEQSYSTVSDDTFRKYWCHFTVTVGDIHLLQLLSAPHFIEVPDPEWLESRFRELIELMRSRELAAPLRIKGVLYDIISMYLDETVRQYGDGELQMAGPMNVSKMNTILEYIDAHLSETMTVETLSKLVHFHPNYFMHVFKTMLGDSPIHYINKKRMDKARQLLLTTDQPVSEIAGVLGLELYYFSRMFKKWTSMSPSEYRSQGRRTQNV